MRFGDVVVSVALLVALGFSINMTQTKTDDHASVRGVPECHIMGGMIEWNLDKTEQVHRLVCFGVDDDYPYAIRVSRPEWEQWTQTLGQRWPGEKEAR